MTLQIEHEYELPFTFDCDALARRVVETALEQCGCPYECEVQLLLVNTEKMQTINREQREIDAPTDVLSFPFAEYEAPADYKWIDADAQAGMTCFHPDTGELLLGDIVLNLDRVKEQAASYAHSEKREYAFLIAHSMLHLLGYDHINERECVQMEKKQREIMEALQIYR